MVVPKGSAPGNLPPRHVYIHDCQDLTQVENSLNGTYWDKLICMERGEIAHWLGWCLSQALGVVNGVVGRLVGKVPQALGG